MTFSKYWPSDMRRGGSSVQDARFECWYHILDVDKGIFPTMSLEKLKSLLNEVANIHAFALAVRNGITDINCE